MSTGAGTQPRGPRGRRAGESGTRSDILSAARVSFAEKGFRGTTIRGIAGQAGVDPALVHHFFGSKDDLFLAALEMPIDPRVVLATAAAGGTDQIGERMLRIFLSVWDEPTTRLPLVALVRAGLSGEPGRTLLETALNRLIFGAVARALDVDEQERRTGLVASQMLGLIATRYLLELEPVASMSSDEVVAWLAPTIQRYLTGPLPEGALPGGGADTEGS